MITRLLIWCRLRWHSHRFGNNYHIYGATVRRCHICGLRQTMVVTMEQRPNEAPRNIRTQWI